MARDFKIPGESMVYVLGPSGSAISSPAELGLAQDEISVTPNLRHRDIMVNAWGGGEIPADEQVMLADAVITINLAHFDRAVLDECLRLAMGGGTLVGMTGRTGQRMGAGLARFAAGNNYIGLNIRTPVENKPWRFRFARLMGSPTFPVGVQNSVVQTTWRAIPYTDDPWGGGAAQAQPTTTAAGGSRNAVLWDHTLDSGIS